jgi:ubiquinone/menaquinone biosynthesis C-methylase UbiE
VGDLCDIPQVPENSFDCIILTQTLHLVYDFKKALDTCYRILKPSGSLLLTVPGISHIAQDEWGKFWQWSFTPNSISRAISESFKRGDAIIESYGNVKVAAAFLYGLGLPELKQHELEYSDEHYPLIITVAIRKAN